MGRPERGRHPHSSPGNTRSGSSRKSDTPGHPGDASERRNSGSSWRVTTPGRPGVCRIRGKTWRRGKFRARIPGRTWPAPIFRQWRMSALWNRDQRILKVMNCESVKDSAGRLPLWQRYADQFPVRERLIYLDHAAVAPLSKPAADAMKRLAEDCLTFGSVHYGEWLATYEGLRVAAAKLIGADRSEIALVKNTSEGIATVAMGLDWKPGDT